MNYDVRSPLPPTVLSVSAITRVTLSFIVLLTSSCRGLRIFPKTVACGPLCPGATVDVAAALVDDAASRQGNF